MSRISLAPAAALVAMTLGLAAPVAQATNGYWSHGYGPKSKAIAGACVAMIYGPMCASTNPASMVRVGNQLEFGLSIFSPDRGFTANDDASPVGPPLGPASIPPGDYDSDNSLFYIPHFGYNRMLDERSSVSVAFGGNGGLNTEYDAAVFQNFGNPLFPETLATSPTGIDMIQAFLGITYSRALNERHSIGITPILAIQTLEAKGLEPFKPFSLHPDKLTGQGQEISLGGGFRLGWLGQVTDRLRLGVSYQSKMWMQPFDDYKGLLAEQGDFDIPANMDIGFAFDITPDLTFAFDYQRIWYSDVPAIGNPADLVFIPGSTLLGTDDGLGFGWEDMNIYKFGLDWRASPTLTLRAGYSRNNQVIPDDQALFNILAPATVRDHYTAGFSYRLSDKYELSGAAMYAPEEEISGTNPNTGPQTGSIRMDQWEVLVGLRMDL